MAITKVVDLQVKSNLDATTADVKELNQEMSKTATEAGKVSKEMNKAGGSKELFEGITNVIGELHPALGRAESGFKTVLVQMWALVANPIGAVVAALVLGLTALYKAFTSTEQGAEKMEQVMAGISAAITVLRDRVLKVGEAIVKFFTGDFKGAIQTGKEAVSGFGAEVAKEFNEAMEATKMLQDVEDAMRDLGVSRAKLNRDLARTKEIITDETATLKEKLAAIETVRAAEKKQTDAELAAAKKRVEALRIEASQSEGVSDERRQKLADAQAALYQLEEKSASDIRSLNRQENRLKREEAARIAEAEKAIIEARKKYLEETLSYEDSLLKASYQSRKNLIAGVGQANSDQLAKDIQAAKTRSETMLQMANSDKFTLEQRTLALQSREAMESQIIFASEAEKTKFQKENAEARVKITQEENNAKRTALEGYAGALSQISGAIGDQTAEGKALAVASALVNTYLAITAQLKAAASSPGAVVPGYAIAQAIATGVVGFMNVKKILSVKVPGKGSGGGGNSPSPAGGGTGGGAPQFNVVGNSGVNQLAGVLGNREQTPVKAYVVPSDVTSGQSLDRNTIRNASIG
jgi:hypothetical protein